MKIRISLISLIFYIYILSFSIIFNIFKIPESYKSIFAQIGLIAIPYLVGKPLLYLLKKIFKYDDYIDGIISFIVIWSLGVVFIMLLEIFLYVNYLFEIKKFVLILMIIGFFSIFIKFNEDYDISSNEYRYILILIIYSLLFSLFITYFWKYPYANENDYIRHAFYTSQIVEVNRPLIFYAPYLPTMHTLYAINAATFNIEEMLYFLWSSRFLLYPIFSLGLFLMSYAISRNKIIALLSGIIGSSFVHYLEGSLFPVHVAPKNFISIYVPFLIYIYVSILKKYANFNFRLILLTSINSVILFLLLLYTKSKGIGYEIGYILPILFFIMISLLKFIQNKIIYLILLSTMWYSLFLHKANGFLLLSVMYFLLFQGIFLKKIKIKYLKITSFIVLLLPITLYLVFYYDIISYPETPLLWKSYMYKPFLFGIDNLIKYLQDSYPTIILILSFLGILYSVIIETDKVYYFMIIIISFLFSTYLSPIYSSYRFLIYIQPILIFFAAYAIYKIINIFKFPSKITLYIISALLLFGIFSQIYHHDLYNLKNGESIKKQEKTMIFEIGDFLKKYIQNKNHNTIVIGEQGGMGWYQGISSFYAGIWPIYLWEGPKYKRYILENIYLANSSKEAYSQIIEILKNKKMIVSYYDRKEKDIERHYIQPTNIIILYDEMQAKWLGNVESVYKFFDPKYFTTLYFIKNKNNEKFYVFKLNNNPISNENLYIYNLIKNPSFEDGLNISTHIPKYWERFGSLCLITLDDTYKIDKKYSIKVENFDDKALCGVLSNEVYVNEKEMYFLKFYAKTHNSINTQIRIFYWNSTTDKWEWLVGPYGIVINTPEMKEYYFIFEIPKGINKIRVALLCGKIKNLNEEKAIAWFDDIYLMKVMGDTL